MCLICTVTFLPLFACTSSGHWLSVMSHLRNFRVASHKFHVCSHTAAQLTLPTTVFHWYGQPASCSWLSIQVGCSPNDLRKTGRVTSPSSFSHDTDSGGRCNHTDQSSVKFRAVMHEGREGDNFRTKHET